MNSKIEAGNKVVFNGQVHEVVSVFPESSPFYGKVLLTWVKEPKPLEEIKPYLEDEHKYFPIANNRIQ